MAGAETAKLLPVRHGRGMEKTLGRTLTVWGEEGREEREWSHHKTESNLPLLRSEEADASDGAPPRCVPTRAALRRVQAGPAFVALGCRRLLLATRRPRRTASSPGSEAQRPTRVSPREAQGWRSCRVTRVLLRGQNTSGVCS